MANSEVCRFLRRWFFLILLFGCLPVYAQYSGNVQGVVSDPAGASINGASIELRDVDTGVTQTATTIPEITASTAFPQATM